jgi:phosphogluconate dehydratase
VKPIWRASSRRKLKRFTVQGLACSSFGYGFAACQPDDKASLKSMLRNNIAIITSYNDMLSAHQPYEYYPDQIRKALHSVNAVGGQVAGGVPAMCDGVTGGQDGMELSLLSREVIAMSAAVGLSHNMFDGALYLGVCDKNCPRPGDGPRSHSVICRRCLSRQAQWPAACQIKKKCVFVSCMLKARLTVTRCWVGSGFLPCAWHLYFLRHRQYQPDGYRIHGYAVAGFSFVHPDAPLRAELTPLRHVR